MTELHFLAHKMDIKFDMLGSPVMNWVLREVDRRDVVAIDDCGLVDMHKQLAKQIAQPAAFSRGIGYGPVLRFAT